MRELNNVSCMHSTNILCVVHVCHWLEKDLVFVAIDHRMFWVVAVLVVFLPCVKTKLNVWYLGNADTCSFAETVVLFVSFFVFVCCWLCSRGSLVNVTLAVVACAALGLDPTGATLERM